MSVIPQLGQQKNTSSTVGVGLLNYLKRPQVSVDFSKLNPTQADRQILETEKRVSECMLWRMQEEYYSSLGVDAWDAVPFQVTSNTYIGEAYADTVVAFLRDYRAKLDVTEPVYLVELATGTGCFSFHMLTAVLRKAAQFESLKDLKIRYVMTDFTENNVQFWENNASLIPYFESGVLDSAVFRPEDEETIHLRHAKVELTHENIKNPVFMIANYFFDTISQDMFRVREHRLQETRLTFYRDLTKWNVMEPVKFEHLESIATDAPVSLNYYDDARINNVLADYCRNMEFASLLFPIGALKCIRNFQKLSNNKVVLISSDKGFNDPAYMESYYTHSFAVHGSFSYMVNYHAVQRYFELEGGTAMLTGDTYHSLKTAVCVLMDEKVNLDETRYVFNEKLDTLNPINNLYHVRTLTEAENKEYNQPERMLWAYISFINMSHSDPNAIAGYAQRMIDCLRALETRNWAIETALKACLEKSESRLYALRQSSFAAYWMGRLYYAIEQYDASIKVAKFVLELYPNDLESLYLIACAHEVKEEYDAALAHYQLCQMLVPEAEYLQLDITRVTEQQAAKAAAA